MTVPVRTPPALGATASVTLPFPLPLPVPLTTIQAALLTADHAQPLVAVTETVGDAPVAATEAVVGEML